MREAVIVSTARTPIGKAYRGALNNIKSPTLAAHAIKHAVERANIEGAEVEDVVLGSVLCAGTAGNNIARNAALAAGLPFTASAQTMDRQCASGLMAVATAAKQVMIDGMNVVVAGGQENISAVQTPYGEWVANEIDENVLRASEHAYMPMLNTAEFVSKKYHISREAQDQYALQSQQRTAIAQAEGLLDAELAPITATKKIVDKETKAVSYQEVTLDKDEGNRPQTTYETLQGLNPVVDGGVITAGNGTFMFILLIQRRVMETALSCCHISSTTQKGDINERPT
ncbi:MAG: hypothetical protein P8Y45_19135 [Exilibacterium sp.]